jgi:hypothetical protein
MCRVRFFFLFLSSILATSSLAQQVLVAVDLPGRVTIERWQILDYPTFPYSRTQPSPKLSYRMCRHPLTRGCPLLLADHTLGRKLVLIR